ncbi:phasin family protein [Mesorhizobium huakuii]|uniref:phasin family protein n=1 Tax=Mesorhizobium huakuii TaxID=28104 RepID=UPI001FD40865|nr:phasin family protein [Mesorhizobium huakuii]
MRANAEADLSHLQALVGAKLPSQVIALQSSFWRKRVEMYVEQAKEFQALSVPREWPPSPSRSRTPWTGR